MGAEGGKVGFGGGKEGFAEGEHGAARVGKNLVNNPVAGEVLEGGALGSAEDDEAGVVVRGGGKDLDGGVAVDDAGLNGKAAVGARDGGENVEFAQGEGVEPGGHAQALHLVQGRKDVKKDKPGFADGGDFAGKRCARAGGLSKRGGV